MSMLRSVSVEMMDFPLGPLRVSMKTGPTCTQGRKGEHDVGAGRTLRRLCALGRLICCCSLQTSLNQLLSGHSLNVRKISVNSPLTFARCLHNGFRMLASTCTPPLNPKP
eukprot:1183201-Prorocentrum_minimum.AAC.8